ncbi:MAG: peptide deformylase [Xanthobacteraceae bacterium]
MAILPILQAPDDRLHTVAKPVQSIDSGIRGLIRHMTETMYAAGGIGLAATQVDVHRRVVTIDVSPGRNGLLVFINPVIQQIGGKAEFTEGCLSVPGVFETVRRAGWVNVHALDGEGKAIQASRRGPARHVPSARNRSSARHALYRIPATVEAIADFFAAGRGARRERPGILRANSRGLRASRSSGLPGPRLTSFILEHMHVH